MAYISQSSNNANKSCGPVNVDLDKPVVGQLWDETSGILQAATEWIILFLKLFEVEEGNGLSSFAIEICSPAELGNLIKAFFKPSKRDPKGQQDLNDELDDVEMETLMI